MKIRDLSRFGAETTQYEEMAWTGDGFEEAEPNVLWKRLPKLLIAISKNEITEGNSIHSILESRDREPNILVLSFNEGPYSKLPEEKKIEVHSKFRFGNYCYDGTLCTYEHTKSGCILCFDDPKYDHSEHI
jgi:hypothetical protein